MALGDPWSPRVSLGRSLGVPKVSVEALEVALGVLGDLLRVSLVSFGVFGGPLGVLVCRLLETYWVAQGRPRESL